MIFIDESIQKDLDYICIGFAYCEESPDEAIYAAIKEAGLKPGEDEYKSGYRMSGSDSKHALRESINQLVLERCKLGLYVAPFSERPALLTGVAQSAARIVEINNLDKPQQVFVDQGIRGKTIPDERIALVQDCDSRKVPGIQLADFVAYHCSYLLKCALTQSTKKIQIGEEPHPLSGEEVDFDWMVRTELRRHFFVERRNFEEIEGDDWFFKLAGYGAFFSPHLSEAVRKAAEETFESMYFGCVW